jgi:hypothetical protein
MRRADLILLALLCSVAGCYDRSDATSGAEAGDSRSDPAARSDGRGAPGSSATSDSNPDTDDSATTEVRYDDAGIALECPRGSVSALHVEFECAAITVYTCKDVSNVVIEFEDGSRQRFEGLSGRVNTFAGTGAHAGKRILGVWVKAGSNHSGDGPGYGERVDTTLEDCDAPAAGSGGAGGACAEGPDVPCVPGPSAGVGGGQGPGVDPQ